MKALEREITAAANAAGFVLAGFAPLRRLDHREGFFRTWIDEGRPAEMAWLAREPERRFDPRRLDPRLRSVISLAFPYAAPAPPSCDWRAELRGRIAAYALGEDYHDVVIERARMVVEQMRALRPEAVARVYVDTGPVFEREWAAAARLGWFGRNTNLINRYVGSYFFIAEIFTDLEFESAGEPYRDHCGTCRQCLDFCPTAALADGYLLEPRLCISYLTIEHRGPIPVELRPKLGNWIFGCDICQAVCPWNGDAAKAAVVSDALMPGLGELMALDDEGFRRRYGRSALRRAKRRGLLRNAAIALGNSGNPAAIPILGRSLGNEPEVLVREHAAWALGQFSDRAARRELDRARVREQSPAVQLAIMQALAEVLP
ncbi:MAG TPA: tRNA epoxyqueuosine(34) reductase QueG [Candidatus Binataceae bacterium]|nr:tRNA epoxyqueuosine(34) reductase QueG [Candidatus Binataceae bacterium]